MSNYTQITNFTAKDSLASGNAAKKVKGVDFDGEFAAISTAITSKADTAGATLTGNLNFNDDIRARFGTDADLQIYHDSSEVNSYIDDVGSGILLLRSNGTGIKLQTIENDEVMLECVNGGRVGLFHNNAEKLRTLVGGVSITGTADTDGLTVDGASTTKTLVVDNSTNGIVAEFEHGGTVCGAVRTTVSAGIPDITLGNDVVGLRFVRASGGASANISPTSVVDNSAQDDLIDLGRSAARFDDIYATNGTINTSDATEKQSIEELSEAETRVAQTCKGLIRKFKWNSAVEKKGSEARYHFGVIAQDLQAAFAVEGLDAGDYGLFVSSTWTDDNGVEQTKLGVRYTELLAFIIGGTF